MARKRRHIKSDNYIYLAGYTKGSFETLEIVIVFATPYKFVAEEWKLKFNKLRHKWIRRLRKFTQVSHFGVRHVKDNCPEWSYKQLVMLTETNKAFCKKVELR
jgi:hypothetical protein